MLAGKLKEQGNMAFKAGQLRGARAKYTKALRLADRIFDLESDEQVSFRREGLPFSEAAEVLRLVHPLLP